MYNHKEIEKKWQKFWEENKTFKTFNPPLTPPGKGGEQKIKPKYYCLDMFPYPSGDGLHVGHPKGYTANDIVARYKHTCGYNILHPMGWDAFGLPAENYAIKTGTQPRITTDKNIQTFKKQIQSLGFSYDWEREINTTDPKYYKWTQWIFLKLFEAGLAYEQDLPINYCPSCKTGLANEEVLNDFTCERCGTKVEKRKIKQWVLAITKYAERLLYDVDKLDWPEGIKDMQRNWIGKSEGCEFRMVKADEEKKLIEIKNLEEFRKNISPDCELFIQGKIYKIKEIVNFKLEDGNFYTKLILNDGYVLAEDRENNCFLFVREFHNNLELQEKDFVFDNKKFSFLYKTSAIAEDVYGEIIWKKGYTEVFYDYIAEDKSYISLGIDTSNNKRLDLIGNIIDIDEVKIQNKDIKKQKVLILHGFSADSNDSWIPWLKKELESNNCEVLTPNLIENERPNLESHLKQLEAYKDFINENTIIIGYSLGAMTTLSYINRYNLKIKKFIAIAPIFSSIDLKELSKSSDRITPVIDLFEQYLKTEILDFTKLKKNILETILFVSKTVRYIPFEEVKKYYQENFKNLKITEFEDGGHLNWRNEIYELPEILEHIIPKEISISVYTTRIDTVFGMTYAVLAPDYPQVLDFITSEQKQVCLDYIEKSKQKSDQDRTAENKEKTGVFTGTYLINPYNNEKVPLWIADYVLGNYGTGAVMAVPAHDERDFEFAKKYGLEIKQSIAPYIINKGESKPKSDENIHKSKFSTAIIKHWSEDKYLVVQFAQGDEFGLVGGRVEKGENPLDCIRREIVEEVGFNDFKKIEVLFDYSYIRAFRLRNNYESEGEDSVFYFELASSRKIIAIDISEFRKIQWLSKDEIYKKKLGEHFAFYFNHFFNKNRAFTNDGVLVNSQDFDGLTSEEARKKLTIFSEEKRFGYKKINYKLRDWLFSRQRYWGEPLPLIHLQKEEVENLSRVKYIDEKTPYVTLTGISSPRSENNIFEFETVSALIQHPEKEEFLVLEFDNGECGLVGGALENGENKDEAIVREIQEETGYKNMEIKEIVFEKAYGRGYKERKDREEKCIEKIYLIKLKDLAQEQHSGELEQIKNYHWLNKKDCVEKISLHHHKFYAEYYFSKLGEGDYAYIVEKNPPIPNPFPPREKGDGDEKYSSFFEKTPDYITKLSQELRKNPTKTEEIMWEILRGKNLGVKFRRQHPFGRYIADFYSDEQKLVIEIDGGIHESAKQKEYDEIRDEIIQKYSVKILRIKNEEIKNDLENVIQKIITSFSTPFSLGGKGWDRGTSSFLSSSGGNARIMEYNCNFAYIVEKLPTYTIIEKSLSPQNVLKLKDFGNLEIEKEDKNRGKFFKLSVSQEKEEELINFLKENLITKTKEQGGNWYADSMRTSNKIIFNGKVFDIQTKKDLVDVKNYGLSVGVPEKEIIKDFQEAKAGEYLYIGGKEFSKIYDGLYTKMVCDYNLPLKLPQVDDYEPSGDGNSPLAKIENFVNVKLAENLSGKRETNTMPQWGGSCWYYLRYMDPHNENELVNPEVEKYWGQVDSYVGGAEHAVLHLLYARFWHKFLFDIGVVSSDEPFYRLRNQGLILAHAFQRKNGGLVANDLVEEKNGKYYLIETGEELNRIVSKMSKSLKNVVNPDEIVNEYGADALRLYEMYMADFKDAAPWDSKGIVGVSRFLDKVWRLFMEEKRFAESDEEAMKTLHKTIKKVGEDIENYKFNTAIAQLMICVNTGLPKDELLQKEWKEKFLIILHPFAPHIAEELWKNFTKDKIKQAYLATGNKNKMTRLQMVIEKNNLPLSIHQYQEYQEVEETGNTALENALQKIEPYKAKKRQFPIITTDSGMYFDGIVENPTYVKRNALKFAGLDEKSCNQEQIAEAMSNYYKKLARENGGTLDFHYEDAWVMLLPDNRIVSNIYKREYILTDKEKGEREIYFPMRNLYISKITGKSPIEQTEEETTKEFKWVAVMLEKLFSDSIFFASWPQYDEKMTIDDTIKIGVQVNGKLRGDIEIAKDESQSSALQKAKENADVKKWIEGHEIIKEIYVPGRIVSIIVK